MTAMDCVRSTLLTLGRHYLFAVVLMPDSTDYSLQSMYPAICCHSRWTCAVSLLLHLLLLLLLERRDS
jgi:hypothetical protein